MRRKSQFLLGWTVIAWCAAYSVAAAQVQGLPASDVLGSEDLAENPTFVGGGPNGGSTAHSEF
jgi:hypothetical protein